LAPGSSPVVHAGNNRTTENVDRICQSFSDRQTDQALCRQQFDSCINCTTTPLSHTATETSGFCQWVTGSIEEPLEDGSCVAYWDPLWGPFVERDCGNDNNNTTAPSSEATKATAAPSLKAAEPTRIVMLIVAFVAPLLSRF
jgi:hypothetical protein